MIIGYRYQVRWDEYDKKNENSSFTLVRPNQSHEFTSEMAARQFLNNIDDFYSPLTCRKEPEWPMTEARNVRLFKAPLDKWEEIA